MCDYVCVCEGESASPEKREGEGDALACVAPRTPCASHSVVARERKEERVQRLNDDDYSELAETSVAAAAAAVAVKERKMTCANDFATESADAAVVAAAAEASGSHTPPPASLQLFSLACALISLSLY